MMKRKSLFKRSLAVLLMMSMVVAAAGCGKSSSTTSTTPNSSNTEEETTTTPDSSSDTPAEDDLKGDEVTIRVMVWDRGNAASGTTTEENTLTKWIQDQVKELYNINVEYVSVPRSESDDKLNIMMSGGNAPDIVFTYSQNIFYNYASNDALKDLTEVYEQYGSNIKEYATEAQQGIGDLEDSKYAVMKQRGTENARHTSYIRKDWLDKLGMEIPTTKEELGEYLYAVKEAGLGNTATIPWAMSGRGDTEKMYLNFLGSYVNLESERDSYIYRESYMAIAPGAKDGLKQLNQWYNDGLITQDFPTDTAEDVFLADVANGNVGFILDDTTHGWNSFAVLNTTLGVEETFVPLQTFDLEDGSYRTPYEYRYAMFVMVPSTTDDEKLEACMKYLNWMADPEVAVKIRYTPDLTYDDLGVAIQPSSEQMESLGYPGTPDDLCIMNLNFDWVNDYKVMSQSNYQAQEQDWATVEWYENYYNVCQIGKFRFPTYGNISDDETTYGSDVTSKMIEFVYTLICSPSDQFDATYESKYNELVNSGLQKILDGRAAFYDNMK